MQFAKLALSTNNFKIRYCDCREPSYGEMLSCDNENCKKEWFHFKCVGLREPPTGKWFCNECTANAHVYLK